MAHPPVTSHQPNDLFNAVLKFVGRTGDVIAEDDFASFQAFVARYRAQE